MARPKLFVDGPRLDHVVSGSIVAPAVAAVPVEPAALPVTLVPAEAPVTDIAPQLPADPAAPSDDDIVREFGWVVRPTAGWPTPDHIVAVVLGIPMPVFTRMLSSSAPEEVGPAPEPAIEVSALPVVEAVP